MYVLHLGANHGPVSLEAFALPSVLLLTGIVSSIIVSLAIVALAQRRSRSYLLITVAFGTLLARTLVGGLAMMGIVQLEIHHITEHGLDGTMAILLIAAVYYARTTERTPDGSHA